MHCWARLHSPSAEVVGETCESIKVEVCGNCNRRDLLSCVSMSRLLCLRPSDAIPVITVEGVWERHNNFFLLSKSNPIGSILVKLKENFLDCFVCMLCLILVIGS